MVNVLELFKYAAVSSGLLLNTVRDIKTNTIHVKATLFMLTAGITYLTFGAALFASGRGVLLSSHPAGSGITGILLPFIPGIIMYAAAKATNGAIGDGDVYIALVLGFFHTAKTMLSIILLSFLLAGIYAAFLIVFMKKKGGFSFPFVPFISVSWAAYAIYAIVR